MVGGVGEAGGDFEGVFGEEGGRMVGVGGCENGGQGGVDVDILVGDRGCL